MKEAFENGKKPRFALGKLYIDGALYRKHNFMVRSEYVGFIISYLR